MCKFSYFVSWIICKCILSDENSYSRQHLKHGQFWAAPPSRLVREEVKGAVHAPVSVSGGLII